MGGTVALCLGRPSGNGVQLDATSDAGGRGEAWAARALRRPGEATSDGDAHHHGAPAVLPAESVNAPCECSCGFTAGGPTRRACATPLHGWSRRGVVHRDSGVHCTESIYCTVTP